MSERGERDDESGLIDRLKGGEDAAYEELVRAYGPRMLAVIRRVVREENEAQDALQDAFASVFRSIARFEGGSALGTWLHRIAVNAALMRVRTRARRGERSIEDLLPAFGADGHHAVRPVRAWGGAGSGDGGIGGEGGKGGEGLRALDAAEVREMVREKIEELPEEYRIVLVLRDIEGLDTAEAAEMLGIKPGAVKTRLHRARQALRTLLEPMMTVRGDA